MKKAFGAILIAVILIVCVVTLTVQRGENAMLEFPERPAEGCTVMSLEITDGKAQTEAIGTYNVNENVLTMNTSALENAEPTESGENYTYTLPESIPNFYFSDTTQGLLLYKGYLYVVTATTSGQTLEIINLKTGTLGGQNLLFAVFEGRNVLRGGIKHFYELKHPPDAFFGVGSPVAGVS